MSTQMIKCLETLRVELETVETFNKDTNQVYQQCINDGFLAEANSMLETFHMQKAHPELCKAIQDLQSLMLVKRKAYGNSFNDSPEILKNLYPHGIQPQQYDDLLTIVRMLDKLYRIANGADTEDPWQDIAGYAVLSMEKAKKND